MYTPSVYRFCILQWIFLSIKYMYDFMYVYILCTYVSCVPVYPKTARFEDGRQLWKKIKPSSVIVTINIPC